MDEIFFLVLMFSCFQNPVLKALVTISMPTTHSMLPVCSLRFVESQYNIVFFWGGERGGEGRGID